MSTSDWVHWAEPTDSGIELGRRDMPSARPVQNRLVRRMFMQQPRCRFEARLQASDQHLPSRDRGI